MPRPELQPRRWLRLAKHRKATSRNWPQAIEWTKRGDSQYHPDLTDAVTRQLELTCIDEGEPYRVDSPHIKKFYMKADHVVGVCCGSLTHFVFAEWKSDGFVHGRPISVARLRAMGVHVDDD